jgi:hypothetical protein
LLFFFCRGIKRCDYYSTCGTHLNGSIIIHFYMRCGNEMLL